MSPRTLVLVLSLATACAGSGAGAPPPEEPRQVDRSVTEQLRDDAATTLEDCEEPIEVLLLEGDARDATYLTRACGHVYSYQVACRRDDDHVGTRCRIAGSEEVEPEEAPALIEEARRREAGEREDDVDE